ncbi:MAG: DoxX family protein [Caldimonas sp.]
MTTMNGTRANAANMETTMRAVVNRLAQVATIIAPPILRIALALPFFRSGLTRWDGFLSLSPSTVYLFEEMFKLHLFGGAYGIPAPLVVAYVTATAELVLPVLLVLGLGTRLVALGLLVMTGVIQLVVPDGWANFHLPWASMAVAIIAIGPGWLSIDHLLDRWCRAPSR